MHLCISKRQVPHLLIVVFLGVTLSSCSSNKRFEKRTNDLQRELREIRSLQAEQTTQISSLSTRVRELTGQIEEVRYGHGRAMAGNISAPEPSLPAVRSQRRTPPPIVPAEALSEDELLVSRLPAEAGRVLGNAFVKLREGNFQEALPLFQGLRGVSAGKSWGAIVLFWIGVTYDGLGQSGQALSAYHEMTGAFPRHPRAPLALLRQGSVFIRLKDSSTAKLTFQKLIAEFPQSPEAARAKERLRDIRR